MAQPETNNNKRNTFINAVIAAAHVGDITHCEAREIIQEWLDMYLGPGGRRELPQDIFDQHEAAAKLKSTGVKRSH